MKFLRESTSVAHQGALSFSDVQLVKVMFCQMKGNWQGLASVVVQFTQGTGAVVVVVVVGAAMKYVKILIKER